MLGVVGFIIGGIWAAASAVNEQMKINRLATDIVNSVQAIRKMYGITGYPDTPSTGIDITDVLIKTGVLQESKTPWGGPMGIVLGSYGEKLIHFVIAGDIIETSGMKQRQCSALVKKMASLAGASELVSIYADPYYWVPPFNISLMNCDPIISNIQFQYRP